MYARKTRMRVTQVKKRYWGNGGQNPVNIANMKRPITTSVISSKGTIFNQVPRSQGSFFLFDKLIPQALLERRC